MDQKFRIAQAHYSQGHYEIALKYLEQLLKKFENDQDCLNEEFWVMKSECHEKLGHLQDALNCIDRGININPQYFQGKVNSYIDKKDYSEALIYIESLIKTFNDSEGLWWQKGYCHEKLGESEIALKCYDNSILLNPTNIENWKSKASILIDLDSYNGAIICLDKALQIDPSNSVALNLKGNALYYLGLYKEAIDSYDLATNFDPTNEIIKTNKNNAEQAFKNEYKNRDNAVEINYKCLNCGFENLKGSNFCASCGEKINPI